MSEKLGAVGIGRDKVQEIGGGWRDRRGVREKSGVEGTKVLEGIEMDKGGKEASD